MKTIKMFASVLVAGMMMINSAVATEKTASKKAVSYKVDASKSVVKWHAKKVTGEHNGTVNLANGVLTVDGTKITGGSFEIDMTSIKCEDLTDAGYNAKLITHLKSDDFFSAEKHPKATFKITKVEGSGANYTLTGDMTIKGITKSISFPATVKADAKGVTANAKITLDRTKWDIRYGSKSFIPNIGDKAIYDDFAIDLTLAAVK
ncbi:YceI family protein [Runella salmonicolor]|uniref:YceI family protein n=1 Tax=Runella salmonicolor TaxID=2950278 RepID=A0ABT1FV96_9BACT|nr:YceI family protein [Runella salmonicolor]MCP1384407.1 YceI family protein [Runella salmonicolor]